MTYYIYNKHQYKYINNIWEYKVLHIFLKNVLKKKE